MAETASPASVSYRVSVADPVGPGELHYIRDAVVRVAGEQITDLVPIERYRGDDDLVELDGILTPGLVDVHCHWVQHHVRGQFRSDLLDWLQNHIWPEERALGCHETAVAHARRFFADTVTAGTTLGMAYSSAHTAALQPAFEAAIGDWLIGNVIMPTGGPDELCRASVATSDEVAALIERYGISHYPITPRFALNCDTGLLDELGRLAQAYGAWVQTHLAESAREIEAVAEAFPQAQDYTDVYDRAGLLTPRSVLGHCIHLSEREYRCLARRGSWIAHCPSSNEALDSGRMDLAAVRRHGIPFALGSDVAAGPSHSMLHVMQRFLHQHRIAGEAVTATEALYRATAAGAQCLGRGGRAGRLAPGHRADFVLMPGPAPADTAEAWLNELVSGTAAELETRPQGTWIGGKRRV